MEKKGYLLSHLRDARVVECPCGTSRRIFTREDTPVANMHVTDIVDSHPHYHLKSTEYYYILAGSATMVLDDDTIEIEPGSAIVIYPGTRHRVIGKVKAHITVIPAAEEGDVYED